MISDSTIDLAHVTSGMSGVEIKDGDLSAAKFSADIPGDKFKTAEITANNKTRQLIQLSMLVIFHEAKSQTML